MNPVLVLASVFAAYVSASTGIRSSTTATPTCGQTRAATDRPAAAITSALASASAVPQACDTTKQLQEIMGNVTTNYWSLGSYYLRISQLVGIGAYPLPLPADQTCKDTFNSILSFCIKDAPAPALLYDSGWLLVNGFNYSISNFDYPKNPILVTNTSNTLLTMFATSSAASQSTGLPGYGAGSTGKYLVGTGGKSSTGLRGTGSSGTAPYPTARRSSSGLSGTAVSSSMTSSSALNSSSISGPIGVFPLSGVSGTGTGSGTRRMETSPTSALVSSGTSSLPAVVLPPSGVSGTGTAGIGTGTTSTSSSVSSSSSSVPAGVLPPYGVFGSGTETGKGIGTGGSQLTESSSTIIGNPSSVNNSGVGVLPFSTSSSTTGSQSSDPLFIAVVGSFSATPTAPTEAPPYFLVPTTTGAVATSEAPLLAGLLFALVRDKEWLKDDKLQDQYVQFVERTQAENDALLKDLSTPSNVPGQCGSYNRKRDFLSPFIGALKDIGQVLSCLRQQLNLLHSLTVAPVVAIDLPAIDGILSDIEDLANKLQEDSKNQPSNSVSNSESASSSSSSSSSSSESFSTISIIDDTSPNTLPDAVNAYMASIVEAKIANENLLSGLSLSIGAMTGSASTTGVAGVLPPGGIGGTGTAAGTGVSPSTSTAVSTTAPPIGPTPTCMADGAPWYSPTSWCDCGPTAKYAPLSVPTSVTGTDRSKALCAFTVLPATTISPISTAAPPTNVPGEGGLPGCAAVIWGPAHLDCPYASDINYCNCGGTFAPPLTTSGTSASIINCDYTLQPTANNCPVNTAYSASLASVSAAAQASLASVAAAASASAASASSQYLATIFNPTHTTTSCGQLYGATRLPATAVPRADTPAVADAIKLFCTPPDGPLVLRANEPAFHNYGLPRPNDKIVFQLAFEWDPRPECHTAGAPAPRLSATPTPGGPSPDKACSDSFHGLLDGCDAGDGQDKHGGVIYTGCAQYGLAAFVPPQGFGPVSPYKNDHVQSGAMNYRRSSLNRRAPSLDEQGWERGGLDKSRFESR